MRCTPNDPPMLSGGDASAMGASRGAVRSPLPGRSATTAVIAANPWAGINAMLPSAADSGYPTVATHLGWPPRSPAYPPAMRTSVLTPW